MIPVRDDIYMDTLDGETEEIQTSKTFRLDFEKGIVSGVIDGIDAISQAIQCVLNTERYAYLIHSFDYGMLMGKYIGEDIEYIKCDLPKEIEETLLQDDRILSVHSFSINQVGLDSVEITFTVETIEGDISVGKEVEV